MKSIKPLLLLAVFVTNLTSAQPLKKMAFQPGELWKDNNGVHINAHGGGILFHNNTYYWFGEHKIAGAAGNSAQVGVHCYSSNDLYHWKDEGIALSVDTANNASDIAKGCVIERPKVLYNSKTRKYVMWFHLELKGKGYSAARAAVATSDKVTGPFLYMHSLRPNANSWPLDATVKDSVAPAGGDHTLQRLLGNAQAEAGFFLRRDLKTGQMSRDLTLFQDDDGKAYLIASAEENYTLNISELNNEYTGVTGKWMRLFPGGHNEAPAVFKKNGNYYLITSGCTGWAPNAARSAVASSIWGPWRPLGNPCIGADAELTFHSQSTYVLPVSGKKNAFIFMGDRWTPKNPIDGRYIWLPITFEGEKPQLKWLDEWDLTVFKDQ